MLTKQEILYSVDEYIAHCKESFIEENWSAVKKR